MTRKSYVQIEGRLHEKVGDNSVVIAGELWTCVSGHWSPAGAHSTSAPAVIGDIQPYRSMIDGSLITSRGQHRAHLRQHNCVEVGNERPAPAREDRSAIQGLREELNARIYN